MRGAGSLTEPGVQPSLDFLVVGLRIGASQILSHEGNAGLEKVERGAESAS